MIKVLIADDHSIVRWALGQLFQSSKGFELVGEVGLGAATIDLVRSTQPHVVVLDLGLPEKDGFAILTALVALRGDYKILALTSQDQSALGIRALRLGAQGFISGTSAPAEILAAVHGLANGTAMPAALSRENEEHGPAHVLSQRELEVMGFLARGLTNREIAERLDISIKTVDTHRGHVLKKLGLRNHSDLTRFAIQHGYAPLA